jgi:hypothetical protein
MLSPFLCGTIGNCHLHKNNVDINAAPIYSLAIHPAGARTWRCLRA